MMKDLFVLLLALTLSGCGALPAARLNSAYGLTPVEGITPVRTPLLTSTRTPTDTSVVAYICPDVAPRCVYVWLGPGTTTAVWLPACPPVLPDAARVCLDYGITWTRPTP